MYVKLFVLFFENFSHASALIFHLLPSNLFSCTIFICIRQILSRLGKRPFDTLWKGEKMLVTTNQHLRSFSQCFLLYQLSTSAVGIIFLNNFDTFRQSTLAPESLLKHCGKGRKCWQPAY